MELILYHNRVEKLLKQFEEVKITHVCRAATVMADALAELVAALYVPEGETYNIVVTKRRLLVPLFVTRVLGSL